jgi:hypothetical protein
MPSGTVMFSRARMATGRSLRMTSSNGLRSDASVKRPPGSRMPTPSAILATVIDTAEVRIDAALAAAY